jgi:hypothetical protein
MAAVEEPIRTPQAEGAQTPDFVDRRRRRSDDVITALHYQLSSARSLAELQALVLVDDRGFLVAGAGAWPVCEELAAYAPLLSRPEEIRRRRVGSRVARLSEDAESVRLEIDGSEVLLCGRGGTSCRRAALERAAEGCLRILAAA